MCSFYCFVFVWKSWFRPLLWLPILEPSLNVCQWVSAPRGHVSGPVEWRPLSCVWLGFVFAHVDQLLRWCLRWLWSLWAGVRGLPCVERERTEDLGGQTVVCVLGLFWAQLRILCHHGEPLLDIRTREPWCFCVYSWPGPEVVGPTPCALWVCNSARPWPLGVWMCETFSHH